MEKLTMNCIVLGGLMCIVGYFINPSSNLSFYMGAFGMLLIFGGLYYDARQKGN